MKRAANLDRPPPMLYNGVATEELPQRETQQKAPE